MQSVYFNIFNCKNAEIHNIQELSVNIHSCTHIYTYILDLQREHHIRKDRFIIVENHTNRVVLSTLQNCCLIRPQQYQQHAQNESGDYNSSTFS